MRIAFFIATGLTREQRDGVPLFEFEDNSPTTRTVPRLVYTHFVENNTTCTDINWLEKSRSWLIAERCWMG
jgi:hypothetical protein